MATTERTSATLGGICGHVGPQLLEVVLAPYGLAASVSDVSIHDPLETPGAGLVADDLVLGVGVSGSEGRMRELVAAAGVAEAAAVAVKLRSPAASWILAAAEDAGVALLSVEPDVSWGELYGLVRASLAAGRLDELQTIPGTAVGDLLAVADATATVAGGPVTIEDPQGRVLAFSGDGQDVDPQRRATILGRRVPDRWMRELRRHGVLERLWHSDDAVPVEIPGMTPRRAIAIRTGETVLGAIWLAGEPAQLSGDADLALREGAQMAALQIGRHRAFDDVERRVRGGMLRMLLQGEGLPETMLIRLGLPADEDLVVLAVAPSEPADVSVNRLLDLIVVHLQAYRWQAAATVLDGRVYVLVAMHPGSDRAALRRTAQDCITRARRSLGVDLRAGVGERVRWGADIAHARRCADRCIELAPDVNQVVTLEEVHGRALLAHVEDMLREHPFTLAPELQALMDQDRVHGTAYLATLEAVLAAQGDAGRAAADLQIHVNTLRYRVRRLIEITEVDLGDPEVRLALQMQLRALPPATSEPRPPATGGSCPASPGRSDTPESLPGRGCEARASQAAGSRGS